MTCFCPGRTTDMTIGLDFVPNSSAETMLCMGRLCASSTPTELARADHSIVFVGAVGFPTTTRRPFFPSPHECVCVCECLA